MSRGAADTSVWPQLFHRLVGILLCEEAVALACDFPVFLGRHYEDLRIDKFELFGNVFPERCAVLADAAGEHECIDAAEAGEHRADSAA